MAEVTLEDFLKSNTTYPFHMPGHKRNLYFGGYGIECDITEISGADNLHASEGVLLSLAERAARLWGADKSYILVNGSTCGLLAALGALAERGDKVIISRNCHKSVYHALELFGLKPVFVTPRYIDELGVYASLDKETVAEALAAHSDAACLVAVSPTYEGFISDMEGICRVCHGAGVKVIADEAHGAHLDLSPHFCGGAVAAGADITVQSLHKTLPALTQTAILHVRGNAVDRTRLAHMLAVFQTSSPSYLLMLSAERAVFAAEDRQNFERWAEMLASFRTEAERMDGIALFDALRKDPSKLVIVGKNGHLLAEHLRDAGVELEYATDRFALAMTGMGDRREGFSRLLNALGTARDVPPPSAEAAAPVYCDGELCTDIGRAVVAEYDLVNIEKSVGRVAAEYIWAYPPGIPLLIPGQRITEDFAASDLHHCKGDRAELPNIAVLKE